MRTAFLFPGQGSQEPGMLRQLPFSSDPMVKQLFEEASAVLNRPVMGLDTAEALASTVNAQLCLLIAGVISARRILAQGITVDFVAGHSIGAFAAAVVSGVIGFGDALRLVDQRARGMEAAYPKGYGMAAFVGFTEPRLRRYLAAHNMGHSPLYVANLNAATQIVLSGSRESLEAFIETMRTSGIQKAALLKVAVPSHCELMSGVADLLRRLITPMELRDPLFPFASNATGRLLKTTGAVATDLWQAVATTVRWYDATTLLYESGARIFIELEPAHVLSKIAAESFPDAYILTVTENNIGQLGWLWNTFQKNKTK